MLNRRVVDALNETIGRTLSKPMGKTPTRRTHKKHTDGLRRFELKTDFNEDNTAVAYFLTYDFTIGDYTVSDTPVEFDLHNFTEFTGMPRSIGPPVVDGSRGWCVNAGGRWEVLSSTPNDYSHKYVIMYESIAPGGSAKAFKMQWDTSDSEWISDIKFMANLQTHGTAVTYVANLWGTYSSTNEVFDNSDVGSMLTVTGDADWDDDDYTILEVTAATYTDLAIDASSNTKVSSARRPFIAADVGWELKITDGTGFTTGLLTINSIDANGVATLSGSAGTCGSTGGCAAVTPYAKLDSAPAAVSTGDGTGFVGAIEVYEVQGKDRAWGIEDIGDPVNHLKIGVFNTIVTNEATAFETDDAGKTLIVEGGTGFTAGVYQIQLINPTTHQAFLDRPVGTPGSTLGYGSILRADPAVGIAELNSDSGHWELVTLHRIAKTALATVVGDYVSTDDDILVRDFRSMDGGQNALPDAIVASYSNLCTPEGVANKVYNDDTDLKFTSNDVGLVLTIPTTSPTRLIPGEYEITAVDGSNNATLDRDVVETAYDLVIPASETTKVSSATLVFDSDDVDMHLTIESGTGFTVATNDITDVTTGVATLDGTTGTAGSTGGVGYLSGEFDGSGTTRKALEIHNEYTLNSGDEITLRWNEKEGYYQVWKDSGGRGDALWQCTCQLTADLATFDAVCCVDNVVATHGESPGTSLGGVKNIFDFDSDNNTVCVIEWWPNQGYWVLTYAPCTA